MHSPIQRERERESRRKLPLDGRGSLHWNSGKGVDMSGPHDFLPEPLAPLYSDAEINGFFLDVRVRGGQTKNYRDRAGGGVWGV